MTIPRVVHAIFVKDEAHCINTMLDSVLPYVDASYILVDDRTTDNTKEIAESRGCHTKLFKFENFAKTKNTLLQWVNDKTDWVFGLAPDETVDPEFWEMLKGILPNVHMSSIDVVRFPRRHWNDLEKTSEYTKQNWYPDWQSRLLRADYPRIHMINYVHEVVVGTRNSLQVNYNDIHHFNTYWKSRIDYNWDAMNEFYNDLKKLHRKENGRNIWPD